MNALKKTFAAIMMGTALAGPATALADHDSTPFTADEKKTLQLIVDFQSCANKKLHAIPGEEINKAAADFIQKSGGSVTQAEFTRFITDTFVLPVNQECFDELGINVQKMAEEVDALIKTHGEDVGSRTKAPAPGR